MSEPKANRHLLVKSNFGRFANKQLQPVGVVLSSQLAAFDDVKKFVGTLASFHNCIQTIGVDASYLSDGLR